MVGTTRPDLPGVPGRDVRPASGRPGHIVTHWDWTADDVFDVMPRVSQIRVPTLAVCGAEDRLTPV